MTGIVPWPQALGWLALSVFFWWLPLLHPLEFFFASRTGPEFKTSPEGRRILSLYRAQVVLWSAISAFLTSPLPFIAGILLAWAIANHAAKPHALPQSTTRSAFLSNAPESLPGGLLGAAIPFVILLTAAWYLSANWDRIPATFPSHWDIRGHADRFARRDWQGVFGPLIIAGAAMLITLVVAFAILKGSRRGSGPSARFRHANLRYLIVVNWFGSFFLSFLAVNRVLQLALPIWAPVLLSAAVVGAVLAPLIRLSREPGLTDSTTDSGWKWGLVYYNPQDPALMVVRRFGMGYTLNMGNKFSWYLLGAIALIPVTIALTARRG